MATANTVMPEAHEELIRGMMSSLNYDELLDVAVDGLKFAYGIDQLVLAGDAFNGDEWDEAESYVAVAKFAKEFENRERN